MGKLQIELDLLHHLKDTKGVLSDYGKRTVLYSELLRLIELKRNQMHCKHAWTKPIINAENEQCIHCEIWKENL